MEISKVTREDAGAVAGLQDTLLWKTKKDRDGKGFLVSAFSKEEYAAFAGQYEYFFKVTDGDKVVGVLMAFGSGRVSPEDKNNSLLKYTLNKDFIIIKQVFVSKDYSGKGVATMLYKHLFSVAGRSKPIVAVVVADPFNAASVKFHKKMGFSEFLVFLPDADKDNIVRKRSAWILPSEGIADFREEVRFTNITDDSACDISEAMAARMGDFVSLYTHEDNLNWTKISNQFVVLFALFGAFAFLYFEASPEGLLKWFMVLIAAIGIVVNVMFIVKIHNGVTYMNIYKAKLKSYDRLIMSEYPDKVNTIMNDNKRISERSRTCNLLILLSFLAMTSWVLAALELVKKAFCG